MRWMIDETIDLTQICEDAQWIMQPVIAALVVLGIALEDATAFARYAFSVHANGPGHFPRDWLTEEQWDRLTYNGEHPPG